MSETATLLAGQTLAAAARVPAPARMRGRPTARRNMHIDQAIAPTRIFAAEEDGVGVSDHAKVGQFRIAVCLGSDKFTAEIGRLAGVMQGLIGLSATLLSRVIMDGA